MTDTIARPLEAHAYLVGSRLDTRGLETESAIAFAPLTLKIGGRGVALLFRYGAVVFVDVGEAERQNFLDMLRARVSEPLDRAEVERAVILIDPAAGDSVTPTGEIVLKDDAPERLKVVAHVLAKNVILSHYEARMASVIDRIEPLAEGLRHKGRSASQIRELLMDMGVILLAQQRMIGRVEIDEKPDVLWDHPEFERLYARLDDEYELRERNHALDRKLTVVQDTIRTLLELVQDTRSHRVEWYIVILIICELAISLYEFIGKHIAG